METKARRKDEIEGSAPQSVPAGVQTGSAYDVERIRSDFPILYREVYGKPLVYLDNAASAQKPRTVIETMDHVYRFDYANVHRGLHYLSNVATTKYEESRETVRRFLNAPSSDEIIFARNATEAINLVADSFGRMAEIGEGDEIVLSIMEHHSNIVPWHFLRERNGAILKWAPIGTNGELLLDEFERLLTPRTKIVAITHMSNVLGTLVPIKEVVRLAHARGIPVLVDGSQSAVHMGVDVQDLDCDFYVFTGHKTYGPTGIGVLYAKSEMLNAMPPYQGGGQMIESVAVDKITYGKLPHKFEAGTPPIVEAIGLGAALNYMMQVGREKIAQHEAELRTYAHARLAGLPWLQLYGNAPGKGAIISFTMDGLHPHDISTIIDRSGVAVRAGHHCAQPLMERLGVTAVCRASFGMYNTMQEVDALVDALKRAHELFA
jgi:cysteine desulfurase/selenocysteine lyase